MTKPATIQTMPRPRGVLSDETLDDLIRLCSEADEAERMFKERVVRAIGEGSFSEVSMATGLSTNTLQRWKREAVATTVVRVRTGVPEFGSDDDLDLG